MGNKVVQLDGVVTSPTRHCACMTRQGVVLHTSWIAISLTRGRAMGLVKSTQARREAAGYLSRITFTNHRSRRSSWAPTPLLELLELLELLHSF